MHLREELIVLLQAHLRAHELRNRNGLGPDQAFHISLIPRSWCRQEHFQGSGDFDFHRPRGEPQDAQIG